MIIIAKQTTAKTDSRNFTKRMLPATLYATGVLVAETITVNVVDEDGATKPLYDAVGVAVVMSATSMPLYIDRPISLQFVKGVTANPVGVQANVD